MNIFFLVLYYFKPLSSFQFVRCVLILIVAFIMLTLPSDFVSPAHVVRLFTRHSSHW